MDLKKLFVWVPSSVEFDGATVSTANTEKIYFDAKNSVIWVGGTSFGASTGEIAALQDAIDVLNGEGEGSVAKSVSDAIAALVDKAPQTFDTLKEIADWIESHGQEAADMATDIAANKAAIGVESAPAADGKEAVEATGIYKRIEDLEAKNAAEDFTVDDSAVIGQYVSSVSQGTDGKIVVARENLPELSIKTGSDNYVGVSNHEVEIKTTALGDVNLVKGDDGKWSAPESVASLTGLATAADVATEIVANEQVVAAALNDHEERIAALQAIDSEHISVADKATGHVTVSTEGKVVTIVEDDIASAATYKTEVTDTLLGDASVSGSVAEAKAAADAAQGTADGIKSDLEAFSWWETYTVSA